MFSYNLTILYFTPEEVELINAPSELDNFGFVLLQIYI